jgi:hypothetical protein
MNYLWALPPGGPDGSGWALGRDIAINELIAVTARVPGVLSVNGVRLFRKDDSGGQWREIAEELALKRFQLPELMALDSRGGDDPPGIPPIANPDSGTGMPDGSTPVPVPVIPDLC